MMGTGNGNKQETEREEAIKVTALNRKKGIIKVSILLGLIMAAVYIIPSPTARCYLSAEVVGRFLAWAGLWAPVVCMMIYAVGVCLFLPGTLLTGLVAAIFGVYWGFL